MTLTLRQLEYFAAVARTLHFGSAATACRVTQPALSSQIQQLENSLGTPLFERNRRVVRLTDAGARLLPRAQSILSEVAGLRSAAAAHAPPLTGDLRLGVIPTVAPYALPQFVPTARRRYPDLRLLIREDRTPDLVQQLADGELDLLLLALEADLGDVTTLPLYRDPFALAVPNGHPLGTTRPIKTSDLAEAELLLLEDGHCLRDQALDVCQIAGADEASDFRASSLNTLVRMVAAGTGMTLIPEIAIPTEVRSRDQVTLRRFGPRGPARTIGLAWRRSSPRVEEFELLATALRETAPKAVRPA